ncbi:MAG: FAD-dependent oxidoreductase [Deltaproteobacteria bacterium]|nr:MAG: FAD-dependent oxidoreductase [Deltaproteobacteria bacterium]
MRGEETTRWLLRDVRLELERHDEDPRLVAAGVLGVVPGRILGAEVVRRSVDARRGRPRLVFSLRVELAGGLDDPPAGVGPEPPASELPPPPRPGRQVEVVIVGAGPAGLFAARRLAEAGLRPLLVDRGRDISERGRDVAALMRAGRLDEDSNFHFGLGGAGAFSDGKLFTRVRGSQVRHVLEVLQRHGAGSRDEILVDAHPHVGTDRWPRVLDSLRRDLEQLGVRWQLQCRVVGLEVKQGRVTGVRTKDGVIAAEAALLACGNSARELFAALTGAGVALEPKPFSVGLRLVHPQEVIDRIQYGRWAGHPALGPASYRLTARVGGRGVYSFCMCPGGVVVPTATEPGGLAINGMSNHARSSGWANAGLVVTVVPADFPGGGPLAGVEFQRRLERAAHDAGGGGFAAPAQRLGDFLHERPSRRLPEIPYRPGIQPADLGALFPPALAGALRRGLGDLCRRVRGFDHPRAVLLGVETRTSSPVRVPRQPDGQARGIAGLFPAGEGCGHAGGITSSAVDGIRQADALLAWSGR